MPDRNRPDSTAAPLRATTRVLGRALQALARAGHADEASILAAEAWAQLREDAPAEAARLTALLHGLVRIGEQAAPSPPPGANSGVALELDVRNDPPARRHERIFETFAQLRPGTAFVLVNDHDPKPLYYQFAAEHAGEVVWQPLEEGPHTWRIRIGRRDERPPGVPQSSAMIPIVELEALATLVLEGLRSRGATSVLVGEPEAVDAWARLERTLRPGQVGREDPIWLARLLVAVSDAVDASPHMESTIEVN
jgi:uncharacterized protein (DUF2249 family)